MGGESKPVARRTGLLDWDGTLMRGVLMQPWAGFLMERRLIDASARAALEAPLQAFDDGRIDRLTATKMYAAAYARSLEGVSVSAVRASVPAFLDGYRAIAPMQWHTRALFEALADADVHPVIVSGAPVEILDFLARPLGAREIHAVSVGIEGDRYTGALVSSPAGPASKERIARGYELRGDDIVLAAGDTTFDAPLLFAAWRSGGARVFVGRRPAPPVPGLVHLPDRPGPLGRRRLSAIAAAMMVAQSSRAGIS